MADVSLATLHLFDKENFFDVAAGVLAAGLRLLLLVLTSQGLRP